LKLDGVAHVSTPTNTNVSSALIEGTVMRIDDKKLRLYATAIALQQMHGQAFAQAFLEDQAIPQQEAVTLTNWVEASFPRSADPKFEEDCQLALGLLQAIFEHRVSLMLACGKEDTGITTIH